MNTMRRAGLLGMLVAAALQLGGCAVGSYQARSVDLKDSPLVDPNILTKGEGDQALYRYANPKANLRQYTKVIVDPVLIRKDGELDKDELEDYQKLANNAYVYLAKELEKDYKIVRASEPGTLRIQTAIIDADRSFPDHHVYTRSDLAEVYKKSADHQAGMIVTTEKDLMRLKLPEIWSIVQRMNIFVLPVEVTFKDKAEEFNEIILKYVRTNRIYHQKYT